MSKIMHRKLATALSITATAIGAAQKFNTTPFLGDRSGGRRSMTMTLAAPVGGAGVVLIQGNDAIDSPASGDAGWTTITTLNSASATRQEIEIWPWMRTNITTLGTGTIDIDLKGVQ